MAKSKHPRRKKIPVMKQLAAICLKYSDMVVAKEISHNQHNLILHITPTEVSRTYCVKIELSQNKAPKVYVLSPNLADENKDKCPPHIYSLEKGIICLFLPREISVYENYSKIVPWISEWLMFYESWVITGNWYGRGHRFEEETSD